MLYSMVANYKFKQASTVLCLFLVALNGLHNIQAVAIHCAFKYWMRHWGLYNYKTSKFCVYRSTSSKRYPGLASPKQWSSYKMFASVHAEFTLVVLAVVVAISASSPCAVSLPVTTAKGDGNSCPVAPAARDEVVAEIMQNVSSLLPGIIDCSILNSTLQPPVSSCAEIADLNPNSPSGYYWILNSTGSPVQVFCEMGNIFPASLNATGSWARVAHLNMTDAEQQCPGNLQLYTDPIRVCGRSTDGYGCDSVTFSTYGLHYQQVCGRVKGYQLGATDAFGISRCNGPCTIDDPFVDGITVTHGMSPREHIWTYAAGFSEVHAGSFECPCNGGTTSTPDFVGSDYYCESAVPSVSVHRTLYRDDPLWDGLDCRNLETTCCDPPNLPWFCKRLPQPTTDNLEVRICGDNVHEGVPFEMMELFIQ